MTLSTLDWVLWAGGFACAVALLSVLLYRSRWKSFPCFTAISGFEAIFTPVMYLIYCFGSHAWYERGYYAFSFVDGILQIAVVWEIARIVMRPMGTWVQDARKQFIVGAGIGILLAVALAAAISPPTSDRFLSLGVRFGVFTAALVCELFIVVALTSNKLGLGWRNHVMSLILGWSASQSIAILVVGLHSYLGVHSHYRDLDRVRIIVFEASQLYWIVQFWRNEPARRPIPPELAAYIQDLHNRMQKNLDTVGAQR
jgi:hypothetical protein